MRQAAKRDFLAVYSGAVTAVLLVLGLSAFAPAKKKTTFHEIDVERINLVEPDGTLRMVMSDQARFPGYIVKGKEHKFDRKTAGLLFFNEEGTENGGLIFGGKKDKSGRVSAGGGLTFDQYGQDQVIQVWQGEGGGEREAGLKINDQPDVPIDLDEIDRLEKLDGAGRAAEEQRRRKQGLVTVHRLFVGKRPDRSVELVFRDTGERDRIVMKVAADGTPSLKFLDENGKIVGELPAGKAQ